jgi:hypothetical protein
MAATEQAQEAYDLLMQVLAILRSVNERNWIRGIKVALAHLTDEDGNLDPAGFEYARSAYRTITIGGRNFSEYCVWLDDKNEQNRINNKIDELQTKLWAVFGPPISRSSGTE